VVGGGEVSCASSVREEAGVECPCDEPSPWATSFEDTESLSCASSAGGAVPLT
jgi:hypothetical protein